MLSQDSEYKEGAKRVKERQIRIQARKGVIAESEKKPFITINYHLLRDGN